MAMTLGKQIRKLREAAGLTQADLADKLGVTQAYVAQLESGSRGNPSLAIARRLAAALDVALDKLASPKAAGEPSASRTGRKAQ